MADPLVGAAAQVLLERIVSIATDAIGLVFGFKKDVERLRNSVATIQAVLADAEKQQQHREAVKLWLKKIEEVAYEADDVFGELNYELLRRRVETTQNPLKDNVCFCFSYSRTFTFRWKMACKIRDINLKLKWINKDAIGFGLHSQVASRYNTIVHPPSRETDSIVDQNVVGRENDALQIVQRLVSPSADEIVSFIPISGMGGIGKTTLAQLVYNDEQISEYFDRKIWVCVSNNFEATRALRLILASLKRKSTVDIPRDAVVQEIKNELEGKRYLLVLDDVWEESSTHREWHDFLRSLLGINTAKGNWSLVTTRQLAVASIVTNKESPVILKGLSGDDCWQILNRKAFPRGNVPEELNAMKQEIIKACQGVPLVASVLGGLLSINAKEVWLSIVRNEIRNMTGSVMEILRLSFDHLPSAPIKKCFAFCSLFRKDCDMRRHMLIQLWMAEGFLQSNYENELEMEAIGLRYFDILVRSSLFQEVTDKFGFQCARMHDMVHDLAQMVSEPGTVCLEQGERNDISGVRYLYLESLQENTQSILKQRSCSLRTMFAKCGISNDLLLNFKGLRVLKTSMLLEHVQFPNSINKLIHLHYLHLSVPFEINTLPESLCKLYNLQTLRISGSGWNITKLPERMCNLISLRHLHCEFYTKELQMPLKMGNLTCLQTLEFFNIGQEKGRQIQEIGSLRNLRGILTIRNLELVNGKEEARLTNLFSKTKLTDLTLQWARDREGGNEDENVMEGLELNPNLQKLKVENFMGNRFPLWTMEMAFNKLESLVLIQCKGCEKIPKLGQLPLLRSLKLRRLDKLRCIGSFYGSDDCSGSKKLFPALRILELQSLPNLKDWIEAETLWDTDADGVEVFPMLRDLTIFNCPKLTRAPNHLQNLKKLEITRIGDAELLFSSICNKVTTLTQLSIECVEDLTCIPEVGFSNNQNLFLLCLLACSNLTHVASCSISTCKNLRNLFIIDCPKFKSVSVSSGQQQLPSTLRSLDILECNGLINLPGELIQSCTSLETLSVSGCQNLVSFPIDLGQTVSLSRLDLHNCPKLIIMPKGLGRCKKLRTLVIGPLSDAVDFDWSGLSSSSVRALELHGWPHLDTLPDQLQLLVQMTHLELLDFGSMESLPDWLGNLASLEQLSLTNFKKLKYLPSKDAMSCLTNLQGLSLHNCPLLAEKCTPNSVPDSEWSKISHISLKFFGV